MSWRAAALALLPLPLCLGCFTYTEVDVRDPNQVHLLDPITGGTASPSSQPGASTTSTVRVRERDVLLRRAPDGSLALRCEGCRSEQTVVSADGHIPAQLSGVRIDESTLTGRFEMSPGQKKSKNVIVPLATPRENVIVVRQREPYNKILGASLLGGSLVEAAMAAVMFAAPVTVRTGHETRPIHESERAWIGGSFATLGAGLLVAGAALLLRGEAVREIYPNAEPEP